MSMDEDFLHASADDMDAENTIEWSWVGYVLIAHTFANRTTHESFR